MPSAASLFLPFHALASRLRPLIERLRIRVGALLQGSAASFKAHNADYTHPLALERERENTKQRYQDDTANNHEFRLDDLIARNPQLGGIIAIDIGSGVGWLSGWLANRFKKVVSIEPSAAAVAIAQEIQKERSDHIEWHIGFSENILPRLDLKAPALFVTGRVLSHMDDRTVKKTIAAISRNATLGSVVCLAELWGTTYHRPLWHVRSQEWWQAAFGEGWTLDFLPNAVETDNRFVGIHGVKTGE